VGSTFPWPGSQLPSRQAFHGSMEDRNEFVGLPQLDLHQLGGGKAGCDYQAQPVLRFAGFSERNPELCGHVTATGRRPRFFDIGSDSSPGAKQLARDRKWKVRTGVQFAVEVHDATRICERSCCVSFWCLGHAEALEQLTCRLSRFPFLTGSELILQVSGCPRWGKSLQVAGCRL